MTKPLPVGPVAVTFMTTAVVSIGTVVDRSSRYTCPAAIGAPEVEWEVEVERADPTRVTYWLTVHNLSGVPINFDGRYAVLN